MTGTAFASRAHMQSVRSRSSNGPRATPVSPGARASNLGRTLWQLALAIAVAAIVVVAIKIVLVLFAGVLAALLLRAIAQVGSRRLHIAPALALAGALILGSLGLVAAGFAAAPTLADQFETLQRDLPEALSRLAAKLPHGLIAQSQKGTPFDNIAHAPTRLVYEVAGKSVEVLSALVIIFFVAVYGAAQPEAYVRACLAVVPARHRPRVARALEAVRHDLTRWLVGRLIAMLFVGVTTTITFALLHLPLALLLGALAGLLTFVEYIGAVASAIPPLLFALAQEPVTAVWVLVVYTALHVVEGYVLTPLLARAAVRLPPALTLAAQVLCGMLIGPLGLTFSTPLLVLGVAAGRAWRGDAEAQ
jgi:predicted PurR-regulated permease PerM